MTIAVVFACILTCNFNFFCCRYFVLELQECRSYKTILEILCPGVSSRRWNNFKQIWTLLEIQKNPYYFFKWQIKLSSEAVCTRQFLEEYFWLHIPPQYLSIFYDNLLFPFNSVLGICPHPGTYFFFFFFTFNIQCLNT